MQLDGDLDGAIQRAYARYEAALRDANALAFEDLIVVTVRIVEASTDGSFAAEVVRAREMIEKKFDYVLVDEVQDTNQIQYRLLKLLAARTKKTLRRRRRSRFPDGASPTFACSQLPARLARREGRQARTNSRSTKNLVSSAFAVVAHA